MILSLALAFAAGLLTPLSPCVLPVLPLVVGSALAGHRLGPVALCAGLALSFSLLGVAAVFLTQAFGFDSGTIRIAGALALIAFGIALLVPAASGAVSRALNPIASRAQRWAPESAGGSLGAHFAVGAALGAIWSPCSGPTLGAAVGLAAQTGTVPRAFLLMLVFGIAGSLPLLAIAYGARRAFLTHRGRLIGLVTSARPLLGGIMALAGAAILLGWDKRLEAILLARLPQGWVDLITRF